MNIKKSEIIAEQKLYVLLRSITDRLLGFYTEMYDEGFYTEMYDEILLNPARPQWGTYLGCCSQSDGARNSG